MSDFLTLQGAKDLNTDAIHISAVANSVDPVTGAPIDEHVNRVGGTDYTLKGFWNALCPVVMPWTSVVGGTLTQPNQAFLHPANKNYYSWAGAYPVGGHVVAPGTDPTAVAGYVPRTDVVLRAAIADDNSTVEIGQSTAGNLGKRTDGAVFVTEAPFNADQTGVVDATAAINAALATGKNVYGAGIFKVSGPLTMSGFGQKLYINFPGSYLLPYHDGDVVRMTGPSQGAHVVIRGRDALGNLTQPRTGTAGGAIVIGYNGGNCMTASVAGSYVHTFYGNGYVHEQGAMVDFTGAHAENCTLDGFQWTPNYDDNNHALINTTHAINCGRDGYSLLSTGNFVDNKNPRHHQFLNAKAFGCQRNFNIETHGNIGTVFSELGVNPDRFGPLAYANEISVFENVVSFLVWQDLGTRNTLYGIDNYNNWTARQQFSRKSVINSGHEGYLEITQSGDRAFTESITGTSGAVSVTHGRGDASARTDIFERIQTSSGGGAISRIKTGSIVATPGSIAANSSYSASVSIADAGAAAGDSLIVTMSNANTFSELTVSGYLHANGQVIFFIRNPTGSAINPGAVTIRWVVIRH